MRRTAAGTGTGRARSSLTRLAGAAVLISIVYLPAMYCPFLLDDEEILRTVRVTSQEEALPRYLYEPVHAGIDEQRRKSTFFRPLSFLSFHIDLLIWGDTAAGFHLTGLVLHLANTLLLYRLFRRLLGNSRLAGSLAVIWAVVPVHAEAVTYIAARHDLLATFFYLLGLDLYTERRDWMGGIGLVGCGCLSLLSKEIALSLPLVAGAYDVLLGSTPALRRHTPAELREGAGRRYRPSRAILWPALSLALLVVLRRSFAGGVSLSLDIEKLGVTGWQYARMMVSALSYSIDRSADYRPGAWPAALFFGTVGAVTAVTAAAALRRHDGRVGWFFLVWAALGYAPVSNLSPLYSFVADRYLYLPLAACVGLVGFFLRPVRIRLGAAAAAFVALLCVTTYFRTHFFLSEKTVYEVSRQTSPRSVLVTNNLGTIYLEQGQADRAEKLVEAALEIHPTYAPALFNLGRIRYRQKRFDAARELFASAAKLTPQDPDVHYQLGLTALESARPRDAEVHLRRAAELRRGDLGILYHTAVALYHQGRYPEAEELLEELERAFPEYAGTSALLEEVRRRGVDSGP